jgi:ATP-binding cassette subfamily B (MDR/TAP) protein 1
MHEKNSIELKERTNVGVMTQQHRALGNAAPHFKSFSEGRAAAYSIFELINLVPPIDADDTSGRTLDKVEGNLELRNIDFAYPSRTEAPIFQNFSLQIPAGKTVALVGSSGSGKSTVIALLERFYDPLAGEVLIDSVNIKEFQLKWLRRQIGLVSQEPALFAMTIKENILYGKDGATADEVVDAAKSANAYNFIMQLPQGFNTQVGERGVQMSGGQKQRIAIARAMLKKPPVLLLDEATSALDAESEKVVQEALERAAVGRTTVVVAHRLSTIRTADIIAVVQSGKVLEMGSHDELLAQGETGAYAALIQLQKAQEEEEENPKAAVSDHGIDVVKSDGQFVSRSSSHHSKHSLKAIRPSVTEDLQGRNSNGLKDSNALTSKTEQGLEGTPDLPSFRRLIALNKPEWKQGLLGLIGAIGFGFVQPTYAYIIADMLGAFYSDTPHELRQHIKIYVAIFMILAVAAFTVNILQHYNFAALGEYLTKRIRVNMLANILRNEVGWYDRDENSSGAICARLASDANMVRALVGDRISLVVQVMGAITVSFVVALIVLWKLALVVIAIQPLILFCYYMKKKLLTSIAVASTQAQQDAAQVASEAVAQHRTVTAFSAQDKVLGLFERKLENSKKEMVWRSQVAGAGLGAATFCLYASWGLDFWYGGLLASKGEANLSQVTKVFFVLVSSGRILAEAGTLTPDIAKGTAAIASVFDILDRHTQINANDPKAKKVEKVQGYIELQDVQFAYPSRPDIMVFKNFNLKVSAGTTVAMVGQSGSGKSTIIGLIERFYDPLQGSVMIDGRNIRNLHLQSLRQHIGLVSQEPTLFAGTIRDNIVYGKKDATEAEIIEAARAANAHNFISALPNGYQTFSGERGVQLSGGQKQRIAIARAVLKNPAILLLDEATSALDMASERLVQDALDRMMVGRTTVVVAHR